MLIIFDLDDTLIDTFGCFLSLKMEAVLNKLVEKGLKIDFEEGLNELIEFYAISANGHEAIRKFLQKHAAVLFYEMAAEEYLADYTKDFEIKLLDHALEVLISLKEKHKLILMSYGEEKLQKRKIKNSHLPTDLFEKIVITNRYNKKGDYQKLIREFNCKPDQVLVVGDKVKTDLLPAKELRIKAVHIQWGRSKLFPPKKGEVDYSIKDLRELLKIVKELSKE